MPMVIDPLAAVSVSVLLSATYSEYACWALLEVGDETEPTATLRRASYDAQAAAEEVSERGLPADVYRAAAIRTGRFVR